MMPLDLLRAKIGFEKADLKAPFLRKITLRQGTSGSSRHHFCLLKACGVRGETTEKGLMSDGIGTAGNKVKSKQNLQN